MSRSIQISTFFFFSVVLLLLVGQTSALLSVAPHAQMSRTTSSSSLNLCPGEGKKLVDAFNEEVAKRSSSANLEQEDPSTATAVADEAPGLIYRIRHALGSVDETDEPTSTENNHQLHP
mmetsp:Transcript_21840/g.54007  ORF Transcript_21840/g.54007 Transcript_21840/m.54007 type:complete len:119 (-) Transcript_21840:358-714(-)